MDLERSKYAEGNNKNQPITNVLVMTTNKIGKILLARRSQKVRNENFEVEFNSLRIIEVIKYPEITKKISTPKKPPLKTGKSKRLI